MFIDVDRDQDVSMGRVCIKTKKKRIIGDVISVVIEEDSYGVRIQEIGGWAPTIQKADVSSTSGSDDEFSEEYSFFGKNEEMQRETIAEIQEEENLPHEVAGNEEDNKDKQEEEQVDVSSGEEGKIGKDTRKWGDKTDEEELAFMIKQRGRLLNRQQKSQSHHTSKSISKPSGFEGIVF